MINPIEHPIRFDLAKEINMIDAIKIKANDTASHKFVITVLNNSLAYNLTGLTARIYFSKHDGTKVFLDCTLDDAANGKLGVVLTTQSLTCPGLVSAEVTIYGTAGELLTSTTFTFLVNSTVRDDSAIQSSNEFTALTTALTTYNALKSEVETARGTYSSLDGRLDSFDSSLGEKANLSDMEINYIPNTITKLKNGLSIKVAGFGDSLIAGAGSGTYWTDLLFNAANSASGYNVAQNFGLTTDKVTFDNYGLGGTTSHHMMGFLAVERDLINCDGNIMTTIEKGVMKNLPPIFRKGYDLAIISIGANGGTTQLAFTEMFIRCLRESGIEVILTTSNPRKSNINIGDYSSYYKPFGKLYGASIADTYNTIKNSYLSGTSLDSLFADDIHCAATGHQLYAQLILGIFEKDYTRVYNGRIPKRNVFTPAGVSAFNNIPTIQLNPSSYTGTKGIGSYAGQFFHPLTGRGGWTWADLQNTTTILAVGQNAVFGSNNFQGFDLLVDGASDSTISITTYDARSGSKAVKTISIPNKQGLPWVVEGLLPSDGVATVFSPYEYRDDAITITCTAGEARIVGVIFYGLVSNGFSHNATDGIVGVTKTGTWTVNNNGVSQYYLTANVVNDALEFDFYNDGIELLLGANKSSGTVDIYIDSIKVVSAKDLYWFSTSVANHMSVLLRGYGKGKHHCKIVLTAVPADVTYQHLIVLDIKEILADNYSISDLK